MTFKLTVKVEENTVNVPKFIQEVAIRNGNPLSLISIKWNIDFVWLAG